MLWLGALAAIGTYLFANDAISIVYGQLNFGPSGIILKVYAPAFLLLFVNVLLGYALFALQRAKAFSVVKVASVVVSTALGWRSSPSFSSTRATAESGLWRPSL